MTQKPDPVAARWYAGKFDDIDRELAGYATICKLNLLDPHVVERVLHDDASLCPPSAHAAFRKLRDLLLMHYAVRTQAARVIGEAPTQALIDEVVDRLRARLG